MYHQYHYTNFDWCYNCIDFFEGGTPNYLVSTTLSSRVGDLNPEWDQESGDVVLNTLFKEAMMLTQKEFLEKVNKSSKKGIKILCMDGGGTYKTDAQEQCSCNYR